MKHKLRAVHSILAPIILSVGLMAMGYAFLTRPQFEDILEVTQLQVVSLSEYEKDAETGCITSGVERENILPGDPLFVKVKARILQDTKERYRASLRNLTIKRNVFDTNQWSRQFDMSQGPIYCPYHEMSWWVGRERVPLLTPGVHILTTDYEFELGRGRVVAGSVAADPFVIQKP